MTNTDHIEVRVSYRLVLIPPLLPALALRSSAPSDGPTPPEPTMLLHWPMTSGRLFHPKKSLVAAEGRTE